MIRGTYYSKSNLIYIYIIERKFCFIQYFFKKDSFLIYDSFSAMEMITYSFSFLRYGFRSSLIWNFFIDKCIKFSFGVVVCIFLLRELKFISDLVFLFTILWRKKKKILKRSLTLYDIYERFPWGLIVHCLISVSSGVWSLSEGPTRPLPRYLSGLTLTMFKVEGNLFLPMNEEKKMSSWVRNICKWKCNYRDNYEWNK